MDQKTLDQATGKAEDIYQSGRQKINQGLDAAKAFADTASERSKEAIERSKEALVATEDWAKENPWITVGLIAGVGLVIGLLIGRNRD